MTLQAITTKLPSLRNPFRSAQPEQSTTITGKMWTKVGNIDNKIARTVATVLALVATIFTAIADGTAKVGSSANKAWKALRAKLSREVPETRSEKSVRIARQALPYVAGVAVAAGLGYAAYTYGPTAFAAAREFVSPTPAPTPTGWWG